MYDEKIYIKGSVVNQGHIYTHSKKMFMSFRFDRLSYKKDDERRI